MDRIRKAVIPAAGTGKRFYPLTRAQPKEMLPVLDKPVIHYVVEEAVNSGLDEILIIVGYGKDAIINYFDKHRLDEEMDRYGLNNLPDIYFIRQKEQKGLADAIRYANKFVSDEPFVVLLGDTIYRTEGRTATSSLLDCYYGNEVPCITVERVAENKISDYGIIDAVPISTQLFTVSRIIEKPGSEEAPSNLGVTGIYVLEPSIFDVLNSIEPGKDGEFQLADALNVICKERGMIASLLNGKRYDIGTKESWVATFLEFAKKDKRFSNLFSGIL
ncbi:MAG: UTP--glucose-1-phosphate uridylyltransferase [Candidatus Thermoplasmatota archaeon]|nr:UTP--glucose-1-phosphate uridylyltransferase [Candidatus Thermoplasmatota archaeon]